MSSGGRWQPKQNSSSHDLGAKLPGSSRFIGVALPYGHDSGAARHYSPRHLRMHAVQVSGAEWEGRYVSAKVTSTKRLSFNESLHHLSFHLQPFKGGASLS